jgi:TolA-binding protein
MKRLAIAAILGCVLLASGAVASLPAGDLFKEAAEHARAGRPGGAVAVWQSLVELYPDDTLAPHALLKIGEINEKTIGDYDAAAIAYQQVIDQYPGTGAVRRARARLERLGPSRQSGDAPLRRYNHVLQNYPRLGSEAAIAEMTAIAEEFPGFVKRQQVLFWIGEEYVRGDNFEQAVALYRAVQKQYPGNHLSYLAAVRIGDAYLEGREFELATKAFHDVAALADTNPQATRVAETNLALIHDFLVLRGFFWLALLVCTGGFILWIFGTRWGRVTERDLWRGLVDVAILAPAPIVALVYLAQRSSVYSRSILTASIAVATAAVLHRLFVTTHEFSARAHIVAAVVLSVVALSIPYAVYYHTDLINLLYHSIAYEMKFSD